MASPFYPQASLPPHLEYWERLDLDEDTAHLIDEPWRHFEPYLASRGYTLCWRYYSRNMPETPIRSTAFQYPVAKNPFLPRRGENFFSLPDMADSDWHLNQTTGWITQVRTSLCPLATRFSSCCFQVAVPENGIR
jgi:hypothetical protein